MKRQRSKTQPQNKRLSSDEIASNSLITQAGTLVTYLFLFLLPTQLGKHFFLPISYLSGVRIDYLAPTLCLTDILFFVLLLIHTKTILIFLRQRTMIGVLTIFTLSAIFALAPSIAAYKLLKVLQVLSLFAIFKNTQLSIPSVALTLGAGALLQLILSVLQFANGHTMQGLFYYLGERYITLSMPDIAKASLFGVEILRPYGTFSHPNSLAGFYLLIYTFVLTRNSLVPWLKYGTLLTTSSLILLSFSKIAIASFLLITIAHLVLTKFYKHCLLCFIARVGMLLTVAAIFFIAQGDVLGLEKRISLMKDSLTIISHYPLFGVGPGNYLVAQHGFAIRYPFFFLQPVHNIILLFLTELGLIGGGVILYYLARSMKRYMRSISFLLCLGVVLITGMFDHYWLTLQQNMLVLPVVFGLLIRETTSGRIEKRP
jgi:hypothetical protein